MTIYTYLHSYMLYLQTLVDMVTNKGASVVCLAMHIERCQSSVLCSDEGSVFFTELFIQGSLQFPYLLSLYLYKCGY